MNSFQWGWTKQSEYAGCLHGNDTWWSEVKMKFDWWNTIKSKGVEKICSNIKMIQKGYMWIFHIPINLDINLQGSHKGHKPLHLSNLAQILWFMSFFVHSPLIPWHHLQGYPVKSPTVQLKLLNSWRCLPCFICHEILINFVGRKQNCFFIKYLLLFCMFNF